MKKETIYGCLGAFKSINKQAEDLLKKYDEYNKTILNSPYYITATEHLKPFIEILDDESKSLLESYHNQKHSLNEEKDLVLNDIGYFMKNRTSILRMLIIECNKAIMYIETPFLFDSQEEDTLNHIKKEVKELYKDLDMKFEDNLKVAITETEKGHFLPATLILSRLIDFMYRKLPGKEKKEKIKSLKKQNIIKEESEEEYIIKTVKKSRNILNHQIDFFPTSSYTLSILGDCIYLIKIYIKLNKPKQ